MEWIDKRAISDEKYRNVLVKWLQFCYGCDLELVFEECVAILTVVKELEFTKKEEIQKSLQDCFVNIAKNDVLAGSKWLCECVKMQGKQFEELNSALANIVFTYTNMDKNFDEIVAKCLMSFPASYLDMVEFGPAHSRCSEFQLSLLYVKCNADKLSSTEKHDIMMNCQAQYLGTVELNALEALGLLTTQELLDKYKGALAQKEGLPQPQQQNQVQFFSFGQPVQVNPFTF